MQPKKRKEGGAAAMAAARAAKTATQSTLPSPRAAGSLSFLVVGLAVVVALLQYFILGRNAQSLEASLRPEVVSEVADLGAARRELEETSEDLVRHSGFELLEHLPEKDTESLLWGTYRPGVLFGVKSRTSPESVVSGVMWSSVKKDGELNGDKLRHTCEQDDTKQGLKFGFTEHDGSAYGKQPISDPAHKLSLSTYFYKRDPHTWVMRVAGNSSKGKKALFFYLGVDQEYVQGGDVPLSAVTVERPGSPGQPMVLKGKTPTLGTFRMAVVPGSVSQEILAWAAPRSTSVANVKSALLEQLLDDGKHRLLHSSVPAPDGSSALVVLQMVVQDQFELDFALTSSSEEGLEEAVATAQAISGQALTEQLSRSSAEFRARFEQTFQLKARGAPQEEVEFAQASMSALLGGLGYFYGSNKVKLRGEDGEERFEQTAPLPLFTAVPSRSFFPRGFLWDEGFHELLVGRWDPVIARDVIAHWFNLMRSNGWIPREQILGAEALSKVPDWAVPQHPKHANPPTFLLAIEALLDTAKSEATSAWLSQLFPAVELWFRWFLKSQQGVERGSFRWHGRDPNDGKLNAMTLSSGLDDYPRASAVSDQERHVDLHSWLAFGAGVLARVAEQAGLSGAKVQEYQQMSEDLAASLDEYHWDEARKRYSDFGLHSNDGRYVKHVVVKCGTANGAESVEHGIALDHYQEMQRGVKSKPPCPSSYPKFMFPLGDGQGGLLQREKFVPKTEQLQFVDHSGYVSLFPLLLRLLPPDSPRLAHVLELLGDPKKGIWSDFGLRSLSTKDKMYLRENAAGDAPYWRGPIWINCNFLAVRSLKYYAGVPGPSQDRAAELLQSLSGNLVKNMMKNYQESGFLWEQYNPKDGKGQRTHPFNGWSSLVVLIMA